MNPEEIFHAALAKPKSERAAFLAGACAGDNALQKRIEALVEAHENPGSFLQAPAAGLPSPSGKGAGGERMGAEGSRRQGEDEQAGLPTAFCLPPSEAAGAIIGPYKLLEPIGEGGMGTVWMAQQTEPVKRLVALKLIKAGMDSKQVIARFEAERQALALMDHPNIAKVFDGGVVGQAASLPESRQASGLPHGRPYFVMELVKGQPITKYCDEHHLTPRQRLELFIPICQAVQHAHQKGIVHRDLKPSNVLVALYDGKPVPKVIDFGVAKAAGQSLTDKTLVTGFGNIVGTLEYMSPEQAEINQLDIDTRSDIYSLGVLLYELLTGSPPFSRKELEKAGMVEMLRVIREEEPSKPSTKLSTAEGLPTLAANRGTEPAKLTRLVKGELDWIVMKALEKHRNRRYETANGFAMDVQRYLADDPVLACPPSVGYRLRKFTRRNRRKLVAAGVLTVAFLVAIGGVGWAVRDRAARQAETEREKNERQARITTQVELILADVDQLMKDQKWREALAVAKRAEVALAGGEAGPKMLDRVRRAIIDLEMVRRLEDVRLEGTAVREDPSLLAAADRKYAATFREYGIDPEALAVEEAAKRIRGRSGIAPALTAALGDWAFVRGEKDVAGGQRLTAVAQAADPDPWRQRVRAAMLREDWQSLKELAVSKEMLGQAPATLFLLALALHDSGHPEGEAVLRQAQRLYPDDFWINYRLGVWLIWREGRHFIEKSPHLEEGMGYIRAALALRPESSRAIMILGVGFHALGRDDEAISCYEQAIELDPNGPAVYCNLGNALRQKGRLDEAIAAYRKAIDRDPERAWFYVNLGNALQEKRQLGDAIACYRRAIELDSKLAIAYSNLANALTEQGKLQDALAYHEKAVKLAPNVAALVNNLGNALKRSGKLDESMIAFRRAVELNPKYTHAHNNLGAMLGRLGRRDEAIVCFRKAIELNPKFALAYDNLGVALGAQNKPHEAVANFRKAIELKPDLVSGHIHLGYSLQQQGKMDDAIVCYRKAAELKPQDGRIHNELAWLLAAAADAKQRRPLESVALAKKAVQLAPKEGNFWNTLGVAYYRAGDWKAAVESLEKSMQLRKGGDSNDWFFLALAQQQLGERKKAREWYDKAVEWMDKHQPNNEELRRFRAEAAELVASEKKK